VDAARFEIHDDMNVFHFYDPFEPAVMSQGLANIHRSVRSVARRDLVIYNNPVHHVFVVQSGLFGDYSIHEIDGADFRVYRTEQVTPSLAPLA
jgi:hypothetical protein